MRSAVSFDRDAPAVVFLRLTCRVPRARGTLRRAAIASAHANSTRSRPRRDACTFTPVRRLRNFSHRKARRPRSRIRHVATPCRKADARACRRAICERPHNRGALRPKRCDARVQLVLCVDAGTRISSMPTGRTRPLCMNDVRRRRSAGVDAANVRRASNVRRRRCVDPLSAVAANHQLQRFLRRRCRPL